MRFYWMEEIFWERKSIKFTAECMFLCQWSGITQTMFLKMLISTLWLRVHWCKRKIWCFKKERKLSWQREREKGDGMREREISDVISDYKGNSHTIIKWDYSGEPSLYIHQGFGYADLMWTSSLSNKQTIAGTNYYNN